MIKSLALLVIALAPFYPATTATTGTGWLLLILLGAWIADASTATTSSKTDDQSGDLGSFVRALVGLRTLPFYVIMASGVIFLERQAPTPKPPALPIPSNSNAIAQRRLGSSAFENSNAPSSPGTTNPAMMRGTNPGAPPTLPTRPPGAGTYPGAQPTTGTPRPPSSVPFTPGSTRPPTPLPTPTVRPGPVPSSTTATRPPPATTTTPSPNTIPAAPPSSPPAPPPAAK